MATCPCIHACLEGAVGEVQDPVASIGPRKAAKGNIEVYLEYGNG